MKLLSVIIPMYNSAKWLPKCLDSVLNQDVAKTDLEIVCINDGSPDNSEEIAKQYRSAYPETVVVLNQENQGPSGARNNGIRNATGKYLCFVDPDDFVEPNVYGGLLKRMEDLQLDVLRFNYQIVDEEYRPVKKREFELQFDYSPCIIPGADFLADRMDIACHIWKYVYRTELITSNQIWCFTGDYFDDTPWLPMVLMKTEHLGVCGTVVYDYQDRGDSLVKAMTPVSVKKKKEGYFLLIRLLQEEMEVLRGGQVNYPNMEALSTVRFESSKRDKIFKWYEMLISHSAVALLTNSAIYDPKSYKSVLKELRNMKVFPLSNYKTVSISSRKVLLFNMFPMLMKKLIRVKNKRYNY